MSREASGFEWPGETSNYPDPDEDISSLEASYGSNTGYTNSAGDQYLGGFEQPSYTSQGAISAPEYPQAPLGNLPLYGSENYSFSDHGNFDFSGPGSTTDYRNFST